MCCGVVPISFGWFLRVPSLHVLVFIQKTFCDLFLLCVLFLACFCSFVGIVGNMGGEGEEDASAVKYESRGLCCSHKQQTVIYAGKPCFTGQLEWVYSHSQASPVFVLWFAFRIIHGSRRAQKKTGKAWEHLSREWRQVDTMVIASLCSPRALRVKDTLYVPFPLSALYACGGYSRRSLKDLL